MTKQDIKEVLKELKENIVSEEEREEDNITIIETEKYISVLSDYTENAVIYSKHLDPSKKTHIFINNCELECSDYGYIKAGEVNTEGLIDFVKNDELEYDIVELAIDAGCDMEYINNYYDCFYTISAWDLLQECFNVPDKLINYIDIERFINDLEYDNYYNYRDDMLLYYGD